MTKTRKEGKLLNNLKSIYDLRKSMRTFWGALTSFQQQIYTIDGTVEEIRNLLEEVSQDIREMDVDLKQLKEMLNKK